MINRAVSSAMVFKVVVYNTKQTRCIIVSRPYISTLGGLLRGGMKLKWMSRIVYDVPLSSTERAKVRSTALNAECPADYANVCHSRPHVEARTNLLTIAIFVLTFITRYSPQT